MCSDESFDFDKFYNTIETSFISMDMYTAACLGDVPYFMKYDVGKIKDLSVPNQSGWTPLMYACSKGHSFLVNYLLKCGVNRKCKTDSGVTPLMLAICSGDISTVENIFDFFSLEEKDYRNWTPLFYAVHFTREKCIDFLLSKKANVDIVDFQNETPLLVAIKLGRETMVELLLQSATNLDVVSFKKESAVMLANESKSQKIQSMVNNRLQCLQSSQRWEAEGKKPVTPNTTSLKRKPLEHCSPTPLKQQLKLSQIKIGKSLTYSPNSVVVPSPKTPKISIQGSSGWKVLPKKFWSPQSRPYNDVEHFLKMLGLEKYWPIFRDEEVDFETLLTMDEDNLKELGITLFGPRKKIFLAIQQMRNRC